MVVRSLDRYRGVGRFNVYSTNTGGFVRGMGGGAIVGGYFIMETMHEYVEIALEQVQQVYGMGEYYCGDAGQKPKPCVKGALTASGDEFDPATITGAIPIPHNRKLRPFWICLLSSEGEPVAVWINDKKNERFIGQKGFDLSPAAVLALTGKPATRYWSGKVQECES